MLEVNKFQKSARMNKDRVQNAMHTNTKLLARDIMSTEVSAIIGESFGA